MATRNYYLRQADLLRLMAAATADQELRQQHLGRANEYIVLAMSLPEDGYTAPASSITNLEHRPVAQQQHQI